MGDWSELLQWVIGAGALSGWLEQVFGKGECGGLLEVTWEYDVACLFQHLDKMQVINKKSG